MAKNIDNESNVLWHYRIDSAGKRLSGEASESSAAAYEWIHLQFDAPGSLEWLREQEFDDVVIDTLTANETRPRAFAHGDGVLLVLRGVNTNPGADPEDMVALRLWLTKGRIITARRRARKLLSIQDIRQSVDDGVGPKSAGEFVASLVERLATRIGDVVDSIEDDLAKFEENLASRALPETRRLLSDSRRQTAAIRRYLAPQRDALDTLYRTRGVLTDEEAFALRDQTDRTTRLVEDLDLARERTIVMQEELQNRVAEQQNARMYVLSIVSAVFLPLSFLTGAFGMNVAGLPGLENPNAFKYLAGSMLGLAVALFAYMRFKRWV